MLYADFVKIDTPIWNIGKEKKYKGGITHIFTLKNESKDTLFISVVPVVCSCVLVDYPKKIILPNSNFQIKIQYKPMNVTEKVNRRVMFVFNEGKYYTYILIQGMVNQHNCQENDK